MPEGAVVDLEDLILDYARTEYAKEREHLEKRLKEKLPWSEVRYTIDRSKFLITHDNCLHVEETKPPDFQPRQTVVFKSNYNNTTDKDMSYNISTERRTRTSMSCTITKGFRFGASFELGVSPPGIETKLGLSSEVSFEKSVQATEEKEVSWRIDTNIVVPKHKNVVAELCIKEDEYKGTFSVRTNFSGKIYVDIFKDNTDLCRVIIGIGVLRKIFTEKHGFEYDRDGQVFYVSKGICNCRFGIEQEVHIHETPEIEHPLKQ